MRKSWDLEGFDGTEPYVSVDSVGEHRGKWVVVVLSYLLVLLMVAYLMW